MNFEHSTSSENHKIFKIADANPDIVDAAARAIIKDQIQTAIAYIFQSSQL
jgi:hypothetical protein